jgi:hypothetical protein
LRQQLAPASALLKQSCQLLQQQTQVLCDESQWQPQMQLLQQGGGEVLLQGLTLAVHCVSAHCGLQFNADSQSNADLRYFRLLSVLLPSVGESTHVAKVTGFVQHIPIDPMLCRQLATVWLDEISRTSAVQP